MMKAALLNLKRTLKYSDTQLFELSLAAIMVVLNPYHLMALKGCDTESAHTAVVMMMIGSIICGIMFFVGVAREAVEIRYQMARAYWIFTVFCLISMYHCAATIYVDFGLIASFVLQLFSALFLIWRIGSEIAHRRH